MNLVSHPYFESQLAGLYRQVAATPSGSRRRIATKYADDYAAALVKEGRLTRPDAKLVRRAALGRLGSRYRRRVRLAAIYVTVNDRVVRSPYQVNPTKYMGATTVTRLRPTPCTSTNRSRAPRRHSARRSTQQQLASGESDGSQSEPPAERELLRLNLLLLCRSESLVPDLRTARDCRIAAGRAARAGRADHAAMFEARALAALREADAK